MVNIKNRIHKVSSVNLSINLCLLLLSAIMIYTLLRSAIFSNGHESIDDITLFNPIYNYFHTGKLVYPIHGFPNSLSVHPPMHYQIIAWLMKAGFSKRIAQSFFLIIFILGIVGWCVFSKRDTAVRIGILIAFYWLFADSWINIRPDYTITAGIILGYLLFYESSFHKYRTDLLIIGTLLVSCSSLLHYYAWSACGGIIVILYFIYKNQEENRKRKIGYVIVTTSAVLLTYFLLIFIPDIDNIKRAFSDNQAHISIANSINNHFTIYNQISSNSSFSTILFSGSTILHIPLFIFSTFSCLFIPALRKLVLLSLPFSISLFLFAQHKMLSYIHVEVIIFIVCIIKLICIVLETVLKKWWSIPILGIVISLPFIHYRYFSDITLYPSPQAELARWCGKQMVQNSNILSGTNGCWYISGADNYRIFTKEQMTEAILRKKSNQPLFLLDSKDISSNDQAAAIEWHINNKLKLYGFFSASDYIENPYIIYSDSLSFDKGFSYFGNRQLWSYTPSDSDSDSLYLALMLLPGGFVTDELTLQPPCFYNVFLYSMKDLEGKELYAGDLKGKKLVFGIFHNKEINNIKSSMSCRLIDVIRVSAQIEEIPKNLSELIWKKPPVKISGYY